MSAPPTPESMERGGKKGDEEKAEEPSILPMTPESKQLAAVIATAVATAMAGKSAPPDSKSSIASTPTKQAWQQCRRIAQYAYNTRHRGVKFTRTTDVSELLSVRAFADASFLDCPDTARSTGGYCVFFCGTLIAFESKRLPLVTLSTAESEYVEATRCATEVAYIKELCRDFNIDLDTVPIMEDNTACIAISANPVHHQRTKHIAKYYHYCRDLVLAGEIELVGVGTKYQVADIFTKPLERDTFRRLSSVLNGYRSYAQLLVDAPTASIATMLQKTSDYANQVYHSLADHDLARYV